MVCFFRKDSYMTLLNYVFRKGVMKPLQRGKDGLM